MIKHRKANWDQIYTRFNTLKGKIKQINTDLKQIKQGNTELREDINKLKVSLQAARSAFEKKQGPNDQQTIQFHIPNEKFKDEFLCHLIELVKCKQKEGKKKSNSPFNREQDIFTEFLQANPDAIKIYEQRKKQVEEVCAFAAKEENLKSAKVQKLLSNFGITPRKCKNGHWRFLFDNDDRYQASETGSGSDKKRGGKNEAAYFLHALLF